METKTVEAFLRREKLLVKFKKNYKPSEYYTLANELKGLHEEGISGGFVWQETPEGMDFWWDINIKYLDYIKSIF